MPPSSVILGCVRFGIGNVLQIFIIIIPYKFCDTWRCLLTEDMGSKALSKHDIKMTIYRKTVLNPGDYRKTERYSSMLSIKIK